MARVLLIQMPFFTLDTPGIALPLLRAVLERNDIKCDLGYFHLDFAHRVGAELYSWIGGGSPALLLLGDLLFAPILHDSDPSPDRLEKLVARLGAPGDLEVPDAVVRLYPQLVTTAREFLQDKLRETDWRRYDLVGFGTMFQTAPSLAMARLVKSLAHSPPVILGGSNCKGEMGLNLHRMFPFIDYVCCGEGERLLVDLVRSLDGDPVQTERIPGLVWRDNGESRWCGPEPPARAAHSHARVGRPDRRPPPVTDPEYPLDALPVPDYHDWLGQIRSFGLVNNGKLRLPIETSRGCWWGEKHRCIFCGLDKSGIVYRRKSPRRSLAEFQGLMSYGVKVIHGVDDILDFRTFKTLAPELAELNRGLEIFYQVKANLTREQVGLLRRSGILWIQPGIESLSTRELKRMGKGVTALQNIRLLKYAAELGIGATWNLLCGFPGEDPMSFHEMAALVPALSHLQPPYVTCQARLLRFSPLFEAHDTLGLENVEPAPAYQDIYPFAPDTVWQMAYYFRHDYAAEQDPGTYIGPCIEAVQHWNDEVGRAAFICCDTGTSLRLIDTRSISVERKAVLRGFQRDLFRACEHGASLRRLADILGRPQHEIASILDSFAERRWLVEIDDRFLSLAVPMDSLVPRGVPPAIVEETLREAYCNRMAELRKALVPPPLPGTLGGSSPAAYRAAFGSARLPPAGAGSEA